MKTKTLSWILMAAYVVCGASLFYTTSKASVVFAEVDDSFPIPIRVVMFVGPLGWLALAALSALITFRCRSARFSFIFTAAFLFVTIGVTCTLMFTGLDRPTKIGPSNNR